MLMNIQKNWLNNAYLSWAYFYIYRIAFKCVNVSGYPINYQTFAFSHSLELYLILIYNNNNNINNNTNILLAALDTCCICCSEAAGDACCCWTAQVCSYNTGSWPEVNIFKIKSILGLENIYIFIKIWWILTYNIINATLAHK